MKRTAGALTLLATLSGCVGTGGFQPTLGGAGPSLNAGPVIPPKVPGVQGPWGEPVAMAAPYNASPPSAQAAMKMMSRHVPLELVQPVAAAPQTGVVPASATSSPGQGSGVVPALGTGVMDGRVPGAIIPAGAITPPGVPFAPGMMPGGVKGPPGAVAALGALPHAQAPQFPSHRTEVRFVGPAGMKISWYAPAGDGKQGFATTQLDAPARYNFVQGAIYRLKLSEIPNRPGLELYPTLEVVPANVKTHPFLAHSAVPISFTEEDFDQVVSGNYLVKVIYLPDPQFQDLAATGPDEVVSTRLEPGVDPIAEAHRRGSVLLVVRMGNIDLEAPNTPPMDAPSPYCARPMAPTGGMPTGMARVPGMMPMGATGPMMGAMGHGGMPMMVPGHAMMGAMPPMMAPNGMMMPPMPPGTLPQPMTPAVPQPMTPAVPTGQPSQPPPATEPNATGGPVTQLPEAKPTTVRPATATLPSVTAVPAAATEPTTDSRPATRAGRWNIFGPKEESKPAERWPLR
ncbi:MAG: hypothetical protein NZ700_11255 [Gemmataceae bacterium]|nr:hypothetical protein [Gemmataceae bacterium]MDW8265328.1 hypothetical protein [Gemmataceae bacterium]